MLPMRTVRTEPGFPPRPRRILLKIGYFITSKGTPESRILMERVLDRCPEAPEGGIQFPFEVRIPGDGPLSYEGGPVTITWNVVVEEVRRHRYNRRHCFPFRVVIPSVRVPDDSPS